MSQSHEVNNRITNTRKRKTSKVFYIPVTHQVEIRARSEEEAVNILKRSKWTVDGPQDLKDGVYFIRGKMQVPFEELVASILGATEDLSDEQ